MARARIAALNQSAAAGSSAAAARTVATRLVWAGADGSFFGAPSPDGTRITFTDWESGNLGIRDLRAERQSLLTNEGSWESPEQFAEYSRWSPDGKQVAYAWWRGSAIELRIVSVDDRKARVLVRRDDVTWLGPQDWSPDGRQILANISWKRGRDQLGLISVADGSVRSLERDSSAAKFSPDGRFIAYERPSGAGAAGDLFVVTVDGSREDALVKHPADDTLVGWTPDGNWVVFCSDRTGTRGLWVLPVTEGKPSGEPRLVKASIGRIAPLGLAGDGSFYYADVNVASDIYTARIDLLAGKVLTPPAKAIQRFEGSNMNPAYSRTPSRLRLRRGGWSFDQPGMLFASAAEVEVTVFPRSSPARAFVIAGPRWADSRSILIAGWEARVSYHVDIETGKVCLFSRCLPPTQRPRVARDRRGIFYGGEIATRTRARFCIET
jgi:hypothetical protein